MARYAEAKQYLETAVKMRPTDSRFHNSLGILADTVSGTELALRYIFVLNSDGLNVSALTGNLCHCHCSKCLTGLSDRRSCETLIPMKHDSKNVYACVLVFLERVHLCQSEVSACVPIQAVEIKSP